MINGATKSDGSFIFTDVPIEDNALYGISVLYDGVTYASGFDIYSKDPVELVIYETTNSDEIISVVNASFLFTDVDIESQKIFVMEMVSLDLSDLMDSALGCERLESRELQAFSSFLYRRSRFRCVHGSAGFGRRRPTS